MKFGLPQYFQFVQLDPVCDTFLIQASFSVYFKCLLHGLFQSLDILIYFQYRFGVIHFSMRTCGVIPFSFQSLFSSRRRSEQI